MCFTRNQVAGKSINKRFVLKRQRFVTPLSAPITRDDTPSEQEAIAVLWSSSAWLRWLTLASNCLRNVEAYMKKHPIISLAVISLNMSVFAVNGTAISAVMREGDRNVVYECRLARYGRQSNTIHPGKIVRMRIENSKVTSCDTIYKKTWGRYPTFNANGSRIAFFRYSSETGLSNYDASTEKLSVSVMDPNGTNVKDLYTFSTYEKEYLSMDWPVGDWVYFQGMDEHTIYKINVTNPGEAQKVTDYCSFRKWDLNLNGTVSGLQTPTQSTCGYGNYLHQFPPNAASIGGSQICKFGGCNIATSPSGKYSGFFSNTSHDRMRMGDAQSCESDIVLVSEMEQWCGEKLGQSQDWPRWSCNSDKWVSTMVGNKIAVNQTGGNQVLVNWVDKEAIKVSRNRHDINRNTGQIRIWNTAGDFAVDGIGYGCYESIDGEILDAGTGEPCSSVAVSRSSHQRVVPRAGLSKSLRIGTNNRVQVIIASETRAHPARTFGITGRIISTRHR